MSSVDGTKGALELADEVVHRPVAEVGRRSHHNVLYVMTQIGLSSFLHFGEDHGTNLIWSESLLLVLVLDQAGILILDLLFVIANSSFCSSGRAWLARLFSVPHIFVVGPL